MTTQEQARAWAEGRVGTSGYAGMCLKFVRQAYGVDGVYPSAFVAWKSAQFRHPQDDPRRIPDNVPVFFAPLRSPYGHVAFAVGDGLMITTNSATNRIHRHTIASWMNVGYDLLGWTEDINRVRVIDAKAPPTPASKDAPKKAAKPADKAKQAAAGVRVDVRAWQRWLRNTFPGYKSSVTVRKGELIGVDGDFGPQTKAWTKEFQRRTGLEADGIPGPRTRAKAESMGYRQ